MNVQIIQIPYDSGNLGLRMGRGPEHFVDNGLLQILQADDHRVSIESIDPQTKFRAEIRTQFELYRTLAERIAAIRQENKFPLILSGNCGATLGAVAGINNKRLGLIWFDAHGDFNTPETTTSGFFDGMGLATVAGLCWKPLALSIPNFNPIKGENILHVGGRDFGSQERKLFEQSGVSVVDETAVRQTNIQDALKPAMQQLSLKVKEAHLHIDLDVLDPKEAPSNEYAPEGGLSVEQVLEAIELIKEKLNLTSASIASYDPEYDPEQKTLNAGFKLMKNILKIH
jgi:arginase